MNDTTKTSTSLNLQVVESTVKNLPGMQFFDNADIGKLVIRLSVGILMLLHGWAKVGNPGTLDWIAGSLTQMGLPGFIAYGVFVGEILAPLMLIFGIYSRPASLLIAVTMVFAVAIAHMGDLFSLTENGGWALELQGFYLFGALSIAFLGSGRYAIRRD